jgi:hypothetical protein
MACISLRAGVPGKKGPKGSKSEKLFCQFADAHVPFLHETVISIYPHFNYSWVSLARAVEIEYVWMHGPLILYSWRRCGMLIDIIP